MSGIEGLLSESRRYPPVPARIMTPAEHQRLRKLHKTDSNRFWADLAREHVVWRKPFHKVLTGEAPHWRWFEDGTLNASENCLDKHLGDRADADALVWEAESGETQTWSYAELHDRVARFAGTLQELGCRSEDRVVIYMPMVPEVVVAMLACTRIGAVHSVVFGGFSAKSLADRIQDTGARIVLTADGGYRATKIVPLKKNVDEALQSCPDVQHVMVLQRTGEPVPMGELDQRWRYGDPVDAVELPAEHPLFILYTSGSTGKPKGIMHTAGGYLAWAHASTRWVFDLQPGDTYFCTADVGWITGHTYIVYGPLMVGARVVIYEGAPMCPEPDRFWSIVERHRAQVFYTAPTAIRALMAEGDAWPKKHDLSSLRLIGTVGEPINPEAWMWYRDNIGDALPIVDTWWQTETGGIMLSPLPGVDDLRPGSCNQALPGVEARIQDDAGEEAEGGRLILEPPWPSMLRGVWRDPQRYLETYWPDGPEHYVTGDSARLDDEGNIWILGRNDDVLNVSGHRIGTMEVESALVSHPAVMEAAVVGVPDAIRGEALYAFVVCHGTATAQDLREHVSKEIGKTARPTYIQFADALPKTRSGKIMRRLLRAVARDEPIQQDLSTLEDASVLDAVVMGKAQQLDFTHGSGK